MNLLEMETKVALTYVALTFGSLPYVALTYVALTYIVNRLEQLGQGPLLLLFQIILLSSVLSVSRSAHPCFHCLGKVSMPKLSVHTDLQFLHHRVFIFIGTPALYTSQSSNALLNSTCTAQI